MIRADFECFFDALRDVMLDVWEPSVILESGDEPETVDPDVQPYPWAIIELDREVIAENGPALKDVTWTFNTYLWLLLEKTQNVNDLQNLRSLLSDFVVRMGKDDRLRRTVSNSDYTEINWTGTGRTWPVTVGQGQSAIAGYTAYTFQIVESRL